MTKEVRYAYVRPLVDGTTADPSALHCRRKMSGIIFLVLGVAALSCLGFIGAPCHKHFKGKSSHLRSPFHRGSSGSSSRSEGGREPEVYGASKEHGRGHKHHGGPGHHGGSGHKGHHGGKMNEKNHGGMMQEGHHRGKISSSPSRSSSSSSNSSSSSSDYNQLSVEQVEPSNNNSASSSSEAFEEEDLKRLDDEIVKIPTEIEEELLE